MTDSRSTDLMLSLSDPRHTISCFMNLTTAGTTISCHIISARSSLVMALLDMRRCLYIGPGLILRIKQRAEVRGL